MRDGQPEQTRGGGGAMPCGMDADAYAHIPDNPYLLLTPGPLSSSKGVRGALLRDWCTWDPDYNEGIVQDIRRRLVALACGGADGSSGGMPLGFADIISDGISGGPQDGYTAVLMQGSGSFSVEATLGSAIPKDGKLLVVVNGAYGQRMVRIAETLGIGCEAYAVAETQAPTGEGVARALDKDPAITHVALVHCETTTGILNPMAQIARVAKSRGKTFILDAMSSFGGIPIDVPGLGIDFLVSSSNKCIQGVPGFAFVIAKRGALEGCAGRARSHCLDLYDQWREMDASGKWRFTSPTHVVRAFAQALDELEAEGGVEARHARYRENQQTLVRGMGRLGFAALLPAALQSPIITSFLYPGPGFSFGDFYARMKAKGFVLYPGKITQADTFRIGNIGEVYKEDIERLLVAVGEEIR